MVRKVYTARNGARYIKLANGQCRFVSKQRGGGCGEDHNQRGGADVTYVVNFHVTRGPGHGEMGTDGEQALRYGRVVDAINASAASYESAPINITNTRVIPGRDDIIEVKVEIDTEHELFDGEPDMSMADIIADINPAGAYWVEMFKVKRGGGAWFFGGRKDTRDQASWTIFIDNL